MNCAKSLAELEKEFNILENAPLTFDQVTKGRRKPIIWTCSECGYNWSARVSNRLNGTGCPRCKGTVPIPGQTDLATLYPHLVDEWDYSKNPKKPEEYLPYSNKYVAWVCNRGHCWDEKINNRTANGLDCPFCSGARPIPGVNDLGTLFPWLADQWYQKENGKLTPLDIFPKSNKRVSWICNNGHIWRSKIYHRTDGEGCPYCSGQKPVAGETDLETLNPEIARQWHKTYNGDRHPSEFTQFSHFKAVWVCEQGHEYPMPIYKRTLGRGCSVCNGKRIIPGINDLASQAPLLAKEWDFSKNADIQPDNVSLHDNRKYYWACSKCSHTWSASPNNRASGTGCPKCAGFIVDPKINSFAAVNPHMIPQWDNEKNRPLTAWDVAAYDNRNYFWLCGNGHSFKAKPANRTKGTGCPYCSGKLPIVGINDVATCYPDLVKRWSSSKNKSEPEAYFPDSSKVIWWECESGHVFRAPIREMVLRWRCPQCRRKRKNL